MTKTLLLFVAQAAAPAAPTSAQPQGGIPWQMFVVYGLIFVGFYFILIAPQRKKQKEHEKMLTTLGVGDEIITNGGIYGVITSVKSDRFVIRIADNTKIEVGKGFIQTVTKKTGEEKK
ncbi:MAG TPA: preprotein translocase subunit YajC [Opitutaceae bacterium]|nr:preprotein translocase subunit YajC [Opitutaceae bacterium]